MNTFGQPNKITGTKTCAIRIVPLALCLCRSFVRVNTVCSTVSNSTQRRQGLGTASSAKILPLQPNLSIGGIGKSSLPDRRYATIMTTTKASKLMAYMDIVRTRSEASIYVGKNDLIPALGHLSLMNQSKDLPYHNTDHILTVTKYCGRLVGMHRVPVESEKALILAALFHDFNHTGGKELDVVNVADANMAMFNFLEVHSNLLTDEERVLAHQCLDCTVYPFIVEPELEIQKIIRDADLLQATESNFEHILFDGLRKELEVTKGKKISNKDMAKGYADFFEKLTMYTLAGNLMMAALKPIVMSRLDEIATSGR